MKHYNDRISYCSILISTLVAGYLAASIISHGKSIVNAIGVFFGTIILFGAITMLIFMLIGEMVYPEEKEPSPIGIRILVVIGAAVVGFIISALINKL